MADRLRDMSRLAVDGAGIIPYRNLNIFDKLSQDVCHIDFGGVPDYSFLEGTGTDNTPAILAAANDLLNRYGGGIIRILGRCRIASDLELPAGVSLWGPAPFADFLYAALVQYWPNALFVDPDVSITLNSGCSVERLLFARTGLKVNITSAQVAAQFAGTPLLQKAGSVGVTVEQCTFLGFERWFDCEDLGDAVSYGRTQLIRNRFDCLNGARLHNMGDVATLELNHGWPFVTTGSAPEANQAQNARPGIAYELTGFHGFTAMDGNFSYDYHIARRVNGTNPMLAAGSICFTNDKIDGYSAAEPSGKTGYQILGNAFEVSTENALIQSQDIGAEINGDNIYDIRMFRMSNPLFAEIKETILRTESGDVDVFQPEVRNVLGANPEGFVNDGDGGLRIWDPVFRGTQQFAIGRTDNTKGEAAILGTAQFNSDFSIAAVVNPYLEMFVAVETINTTGNETVIYVSGETTIQSFQSVSKFAGRTFVMIATTALTIGGAGNILTPGGIALNIPINSRIAITSDGTSFRLSL